MKFSEQWLRTWVNPSLSTRELAEQLTMAGLEIEKLEPLAGEFTKVIVGEILEATQHPDADRLKVCTVSVGVATPLQIVCGGINARAGIKVAVAICGAVLPGGFEIKKAKLRGVASEGMLCSAKELGLAQESQGILELPLDAVLGQDVREALELNDHIFELKLTPNRGDCCSILGIAREVAALNHLVLSAPDTSPVAPFIDEQLSIEIQAPAACPRYVGRVIRDININAPLPKWLSQRLERSGLRHHDAIVDITNYVLLELGQPMHAFDLQKIEGGIVVRSARENEKIKLLDGSEIELKQDCLVIADAKKPLAFAGIMGGDTSAVSQTTKDIFLESAFFAPEAIAGRGRRYGLQTDSSYRFERGVDPTLQVKALERATALILAIAGGKPGPVIEVTHADQLPAQKTIHLQQNQVTRILGFALTSEQIQTYLAALGMSVDTNGQEFKVQIPPHRFDISIPEDLIEELARIHGYSNIPNLIFAANQSVPMLSERQLAVSRIKSCLLDRGYNEAITYSFVSPTLQQLLFPDQQAMTLMNPISEELSQMRLSLWTSLLPSLLYNLNRQQARVRLFEVGLRFIPQGEQVLQQAVIAGLVYGDALPEQWGIAKKTTDFYDVKADLEGLLALAPGNQQWQFVAGEHSALHPGQTAKILHQGKDVGFIGGLHPRILQHLEITSPVFLFELDLAALQSVVPPIYHAISKFPAIRRDISFTIAETISAQAIVHSIQQVAGDGLQGIEIFDVYQGEHIPSGQKSMALGLTLQDQTRTLTDEEIADWVKRIVSTLEQSFSIQLRG